MFRPEAPSRSNLSSSPSGPRLLGQLLPDLILKIGLRALDYNLAHGQVDEAHQIFKTLSNAVSFEGAT